MPRERDKGGSGRGKAGVQVRMVGHTWPSLRAVNLAGPVERWWRLQGTAG
jgi:hypothetical protein